MTLSLQEPTLVGCLISVDNAPVVASIGSDFLKYIQGMRDIEKSKIIKRPDADRTMERYEKVRHRAIRLNELWAIN